MFLRFVDVGQCVVAIVLSMADFGFLEHLLFSINVSIPSPKFIIRNLHCDFRPEFVSTLKFAGFQLDEKSFLRDIDAKETIHDVFKLNYSENSRGSNAQRSKTIESDSVKMKEPSEKELQQLMGRGIVKPSLAATIRSLENARNQLRTESEKKTNLMFDNSDSLTSLKSVVFVLGELVRWQNTEKQWRTKN